jgi:hypothetical protein
MADSHDVTTDDDGHGGEVHGHDEIHMPPNSWSPIVLAVTVTATFIGLIVGPWLWITGLAATVVTLVAWLRAARTEFSELPD